MELSDLITIDPDIFSEVRRFSREHAFRSKRCSITWKTITVWKNFSSASRRSRVRWHGRSWNVPKRYCLRQRENPAGRVRPMAHAAAAHRARLHQRPETGVVGHKERRTTGVGCEGVRSFYHVRSEHSVSTESSPFYDCCLGTLD